LQEFRENSFPELEVETSKTNLVNGIAASYYGVSNTENSQKFSAEKYFICFPKKLATRK